MVDGINPGVGYSTRHFARSGSFVGNSFLIYRIFLFPILCVSWGRWGEGDRVAAGHCMALQKTAGWGKKIGHVKRL